MTTVFSQGSFKIEFNGKATYFVTDTTGQVWASVDTLRKAQNRLKKILENYPD